MIDYQEYPNVPQAIVNYIAKNHLKHEIDFLGTPQATRIKYLTIWDNQELYMFYFIRQKPIGPSIPMLLLYDCKNIKEPNLNESNKIYYYLPRYLDDKNVPHLCKSENFPNNKLFNRRNKWLITIYHQIHHQQS